MATTNLESVKLLNKLSWLSGLLISVLIAFVVPQMIIPIFGVKFLDSANVLIWLAPLGFAMSATYASDSWLQISGFQNHLFFRGVFGASTNIILNLALIPEYGVYGAAFSTSISHLASIFIPGLLVKGTRQNTVQLLFPF